MGADFDTQNRFTIYDQNGQVVFYALEDSDCCARQCCGPSRSFDMKILDIYQNEVIHIYRPLACQSCCCFCCLMVMPTGHKDYGDLHNFGCGIEFSMRKLKIYRTHRNYIFLSFPKSFTHETRELIQTQTSSHHHCDK